MSKLKNRLNNYKNRFLQALSRARKAIIARWRSLAPGFRYAVIYFVCVVCIGSVIWWQFSPGSSLVFDPTVKRPAEEQNLQDPAPETSDEEEQSADVVVFSPERGDKLTLPLAGEILASFGEPFNLFPGLTSGGLDGIHIDGTIGDDVHVAWQGVVVNVISPDPYETGQVKVKHGEWVTVYKNIEKICVQPGQEVQKGQKIGELAGKLVGVYSGDYLEFQLWGPDQEVRDPWQYFSIGH